MYKHSSLNSMRPFLLAVLVLGAGCASQSMKHGGKIDNAALLLRYDENNRKPSPIVEYLGRSPEVLLYPDGLFMISDSCQAEGKPKSPWLAGHLTPNQLTNLLAGLCSMEGFWGLQKRYVLVRGYDLPSCHVTLRIPGRPEKTVGVVGWMSTNSAPCVVTQKLGTGEPPKEFVEFAEALTRIRPDGLGAWDPGYLEIEFSDYSNALGTLKWPAKWPSLNSPLVRERWGDKIMIFPSERAPELDAFLATRSDYTAVLIDDWKTAVGYRWPLPGEKKWTPLK